MVETINFMVETINLMVERTYGISIPLDPYGHKKYVEVATRKFRVLHPKKIMDATKNRGADLFGVVRDAFRPGLVSLCHCAVKNC